jgi:hypothetical protein
LLSRFAAALVSIVFGVGLAYAQDFRATLNGRVLDSGGAPVPNAKLRVTNTATRETRDVVTDSHGDYVVPVLNPGLYFIRAEAQGFKTAVREGFELTVGQTATLDLQLELGSMTTSVVVAAEAPLVEDANGDRGSLIDEQSVKEYPLNSRNPFMLAMLTPGVNFDGELTYQRPFDNGAIANWTVNGASQRMEFLIDGAPNNSQAGSNNIAFVPPVDAVQQFRIQTSAYDAQYGRGAGSVNVALKSGGNKLHGAVYEFARRSAWDANSFQNKARCVSFDANGRCQGAPKDGHFLDQYGIQFDGPVYLPHLYDGRNKTFFLVNYERYREGSPQPLVLSVPELEMRKGDFSKLVDASGRAITIYDPSTGHQVGSQWVRDPFPGNVIPGARISPTAALLIKYFPLPNTFTPGVNYSTSNYFISGGDASARDRFHNLVTKVDRNVGDRQHLFVRYGQNDRYEMRTYNGIFDKPGADGQLPLRRANWTGGIGWTATLGGATILDVRASMSRFIDPSTADANKNFDLVGAGFSPSLVSQLPYGEWFPRINISGFQSLGRNPNFGASATNTFSLQPSIIYSRGGGKTLRAGVDLRWTQYSTQNSGQIMTFSAADTFTRADYQRSDGVSGSGLATWLLGDPTSGSVNINMYPIYMFPYYAPWAQYDWKLRRNLTINLGIRWDANLPPVERYDRMNRGFDSNVISPVNGLIDHTKFPYINFPLRGGLLFAGVNGLPHDAADPYYKTIQPRFGMAWSPVPKLVIRGGWGRYFINPNNDYLQNVGYNASSSLNASPDSNKTAFSDLLSNPFPVINQPTGNTRGLMSFVGNSFSFANQHFEVPHVDQFSFSVQRPVGSQAVLDIAYVGSRGHRLQSTMTYNDDADSTIRDQCNYLMGATSQSYCTQGLANPFRNVPGFEGTAFFTNSTRSRYDLSRVFPQFNTSLTEYMRNDGLSWYNAVQNSFVVRTRRGITLNTNYTFSKTMERNGFLDNLDGVMQQGLSANDRPHKFVFSMIGQLPVGKGRRWFNGSHGILSQLASGWEATTIFQIYSGKPWTLPGNVLYLKDARNPNFTWDANKVQAVKPCVLNWDNTNKITWEQYSLDYGCTQSNWIIVPSYNPRYTPYYDGRVRLQTVHLMDASLNKMTRISERYNVQFRMECFNVMNSFFINTAQFNNDPTNPNFGSINKATVSAPQSNYPRQIQLGLKFLW